MNKNLIKVGTSSDQFGLSLINFNNDLYFKSRNGLFKLTDGSFKSIILKKGYSTVIGNNMAVFKNSDNKKWLLVSGMDEKSEKNVLIFYSATEVKVIDLPANHSLPHWSYIQQHNASLYLFLEEYGEYAPYSFSGTSWEKIICPDGYSVASNPSSIPAYYPSVNLLNFHVGIHMVFREDSTNLLKPFSYKPNTKGEYVFEQWKGIDNLSYIAGTQMINYTSNNTLVSFLQSITDNSKNMYHHVKGGDLKYSLPHGTAIKAGYPCIEWANSILVPLFNGTSVNYYSYKSANDFSKIIIPNNFYIRAYEGIAVVSQKLYITVSDGNAIYILGCN